MASSNSKGQVPFPPMFDPMQHYINHMMLPSQIPSQPSAPPPQKTSTPKTGTAKNAAPATIPIVEVSDEGVEWITFTYSVKGVSREYKIRTDIDKIDIESIDMEFKHNNCVYPRAFVPKEQYAGNRWDYETSVNLLGWKLSWLNQEALCGKRGLIQRAVDSYRNRFPEMKSRRVIRQEKLVKGTLRRRNERSLDDLDTPSPKSTSAPSSALATQSKHIMPSHHSKQHKQPQPMQPPRHHHQTPPFVPGVHDSTFGPTADMMFIENPAKKLKVSKHLTVESITNQAIVKTRIQCDIDGCSLGDIPDDFRRTNAVFPRANVPPNEYTGTRFEYENQCNEIAWKLAWLNPGKLHGKKCLLQRALDTYRIKFDILRPRRGKRAVEEVTASDVLDSADAVYSSAGGVIAAATFPESDSYENMYQPSTNGSWRN